MKYVKVVLRLLAFIGFMITVAYLAILPEIIGDEAKEVAKNLTGNDYFLPKVLVLGAICLVIISFWTDGSNFFGKTRAKESTATIEDSLFEKARAGQREEFERRSAAKLAGRDFIDIEVSYTVKGSNMLGDQMNVGVREGQREEDIHKVFEEADGRLLIIGTPGSGKTTLLLTLAKKLLDDYPEKIPVVLDIATWQPRFKTIEDWAIELLPDMGFNKALAKEVVGEDKILPLFDGLDELAEGSRASFLQAVESYGMEASKKFVVTSRVDEYSGTIDAAVERQVIMEPFEVTHIWRALDKKFAPERPAIMKWIDMDEHFRHAIQTPFYLNAAQHLFAKKSNATTVKFAADSLEGRKREIEDAFVENALNNIKGFEVKDASKWLAFLADRMARRGLVRFELVDMQYDWVRLNRQSKNVALMVMVIAVASWSFVFMLLVALLVGLGFINGIICSFLLLIFLFVIFYFNNLPLSIVAKGLLNLNFKNYFSTLTGYVLGFLIGGVSVDLAFTILIAFGFLDYNDNVVGKITVLSLICWALAGVGELLMSSRNNYLKIRKPYKKFLMSALVFHLSIFQHWHLKYLMNKRNIVPREFVSFLCAVSALHLLETDGGSWRFRHKKIQDHFVKLWEREYAVEFPDGYIKSAENAEE